MIPTETAAHCYATSTECSGALVESLLTRSNLNYMAHRMCVRMGSWGGKIARSGREEKALEATKAG
eukprot:6951341-Ditylum_brightwellii.AAC.1